MTTGTWPSGGRGASASLLICLAGALAIPGLHFLFSPALLRLPPETLMRIAALGVILIFWLMWRASRRGIWSVAYIYFAIFAVFHFGLVVFVGLGLVPDRSILSDTARRLLAREEVVYAIVLAFFGLLAYVVGVHAARLLPAPPARAEAEPPETGHYFTRLGSLMLTGLVVLGLLLLIRTNGWQVFSSGYSNYRATKGSAALNAFWPLMRMGMCWALSMLVSAPSSRVRSWSLLLYLFWGALVFQVGARGDALFPAMTAFVVFLHRRPLVRTVRGYLGLAALALFLLAAIAAVRATRGPEAERSASAAVEAADPASALMEMGGSLRTVVEVQTWEAQGEARLSGASYWAPVERMLTRLVPGQQRLPAPEDKRLMNVAVMAHLGLDLNDPGAPGFSPVAEGYRNFGVPGVCLALFLLGFLFGRMDFWPITCRHQLLIGVIFFPLLVMVRNAFASVPGQIFMGLGFTMAVLALGELGLAERRRPAEPAAGTGGPPAADLAAAPPAPSPTRP